MKALRFLVFLIASFLLLANAASKPPIHLQQGSFKPAQQSFGAQQNEQSADYHLLQFEEPTTREYRQRLSDKANFISYIPENAWLVKLKSDIDELSNMRSVSYIGSYEPSYKISPLLENEMRTGSGKATIVVQMFEEAGSPSEVLEGYGKVKEKFGPHTWLVESRRSEIGSIADESAVRWVGPEPQKPSTFNDDSRDVIEVEQLQSSPFNMKGDGFTAAVWDGGWAGQHDDLNYSNKLIIGDKGCTESECSVQDHATHVSGTLAGKGNIDSTKRGMAPDAQIISYEWPGSASEVYSETEDSISKYDALLSQNSWGYPSNDLAGEYSTVYLSDSYDAVVSGQATGVSDVLSVVFSAGNFRNEVSRSYNTTMPPSTAKNVVTVGAVNDQVQMTAYSSWGPTDDGRIKPTVVADGGDCYQISSTLPGDNYGEYCGTSMAAPAVSGAVVLLNQRFNTTHGELPEPATVKSTLIHTAKDLNSTGPDYKTGWGLVNATAAIKYIDASEGRELYRRKTLSDVEDNTSFTTTLPEGDSADFTLVWSDHPASTSSGKALVNDLDLVVRNSEGVRKYPWTQTWENRGNPALQNQEDHRNPVEQVSLSSADTKKYTVKVKASAMPESPQDYSLLLPKASAPIPELEIESPESTNYTRLPDFNLSSDTELSNAKFSIDGSMNYSMKEKNSTYFYNTSHEVSDGDHEVVFWANNSNNFSVSENISFSVDRAAPNLKVSKPGRHANISGNFSINATWGDNFAGIRSYNFTISNSTYSSEGVLNSTFNSSKLSDGDYNITYNVSDDFGNYNSSTISVTVDNEKPGFNFYSPKDGDAFSSGVDIEAIGKDNVTGVKTANYTLENESFNDSGVLNSSFSSSELGESSYNITYLLKDFAGNVEMKKVEVFHDTVAPNLSISEPRDNSFVKANFSVNATFKDSLSGVVEANYSVSNETTVFAGDLNDTLDTSNLSDSEYNITFTAVDAAGNTNTSRINVTLDSVLPKISLESPGNGESIAGNFSVNATYSDNLEVVKANYSLLNGTLQESGPLNATVNSSAFADGDYVLRANVSDRAGNSNSSKISVKFDNTPPEVRSSTVVENDNISGTIDVNFTLKEATGVQLSEFRWLNATGNVTNWRQMNYTGFDTTNFSDGIYNLSIRLNDSLGNFRKRNLTSIAIDNTEPDIALKEYNLTEETGEWIKDNKTVQMTCQDNVSGVEEVSAAGESSDESPANFTLEKSGKNSYSFSCSDYAGNSKAATETFSIDTEKPVLDSLSPSEGSTTERTVEIEGEFFNESKESGINVSATSIESSSGDIDVEIFNASFSSTVENLDYSESYTLEGELVDKVGHSHSFSADYSVEEEDSGGGGGGGGGFSAPPDDDADEDEENEDQDEQNDTETVEEEPQDNTTVNDTEDEEISCEVSAARGNDCRMFERCSAPEGWEQVENCESWDERRARELVESLPDNGGEAVEAARAELESGNYSGAIAKALEAQKAEEERKKADNNGLNKVLPLAIAFTVLVAAGVLFRFYRKRKLVKKVEESSEEVLNELQDKKTLSPEEQEKLAEAAEEIENEEYKNAEEKMDDIIQ